MQFRDACQNTEIWRPWLPIADFMLGNCPEEDLLTTYPDHKGRHTMAKFAMAIESLSRDNRDATREHFQAVRTANISGMYRITGVEHSLNASKVHAPIQTGCHG